MRVKTSYINARQPEAFLRLNCLIGELYGLKAHLTLFRIPLPHSRSDKVPATSSTCIFCFILCLTVVNPHNLFMNHKHLLNRRAYLNHMSWDYCHGVGETLMRLALNVLRSAQKDRNKHHASMQTPALALEKSHDPILGPDTLESLTITSEIIFCASSLSLLRISCFAFSAFFLILSMIGRKYATCAQPIF